MYFEDNITELDEIIEIDDIKIVVDSVSFQYLENTTIDFQERNIGSGFKFESPDIKGSCRLW